MLKITQYITSIIFGIPLFLIYYFFSIFISYNSYVIQNKYLSLFITFFTMITFIPNIIAILSNEIYYWYKLDLRKFVILSLISAMSVSMLYSLYTYFFSTSFFPNYSLFFVVFNFLSILSYILLNIIYKKILLGRCVNITIFIIEFIYIILLLK